MRLLQYKRSRATLAFTILEVVIALLIAAFVSIAFMGSIVYLVKQNTDNRRHLAAVTIATYYQGLLFAANPERIGEPDVSSTEFEGKFDYDEDDPLIVVADPENSDKSDKFRVYFRFTGFGNVSSSEDNSLTVTFPDNQEEWETNEWAGSYVTVNSSVDAKKAQVMRIVSNTGTKLTVTADLTGEDTSQGWQKNPTSDYIYHINNGRTVVMTVEWGDGEDYRKVQRTIILQKGQRESQI